MCEMGFQHRPVTFGVVGHVALKSSGHDPGVERMTGLGQPGGIGLPQRRVRRQKRRTQQACAPRALRSLVTEPDRQVLLDRLRLNTVRTEQLPKPADGVVGLSVARLQRRVEELELGNPVPVPRPRSSRPPDRMSTTTLCSAISAGWCRGAMRIAVPNRIRLVRAAAAAANVSGLVRYPSSNRWCSENHAEDAPRCSASSHISRVNP